MKISSTSDDALAVAKAELARLAPEWLAFTVTLVPADHTRLAFTWGGEASGTWSRGLDDTAHGWLPLEDQAIQAVHDVIRHALNGYIPLDALVELMAAGPDLSRRSTGP